MDASSASEPTVSVVVPTYGRPDYLLDAIESVAAQTYSNVELVVVDDHSPEPVEPHLRELSLDGLSWRCLRHEENRGANAARRTGIDATDGEFVAFLDDDDYWTPTLVERYMEAFESGGPDVGVVAAGVRVVGADGEQIGRVVPDYAGDVTERLLRGTLQAATFSRFAVRRDVFDAAGYPDERLPSLQDREWHIRLSRRTRYASVPEALVVRRVTGHGQITDDFEAKRDESVPRIVEKHESLAASYGDDCRREFLAHFDRTLGFSALRNGYYRDSVRYLVRSIRRDPTQTSTYGYLLLALGGPLTYGSARRAKRWLSGRVSA
jgi:glycosyltransferase involved in cell wall biosynthesis